MSNSSILNIRFDQCLSQTTNAITENSSAMPVSLPRFPRVLRKSNHYPYTTVPIQCHFIRYFNYNFSELLLKIKTYTFENKQ